MNDRTIDNVKLQGPKSDKDKEKNNDPIEELDTIVATLKKTFEGQLKTIKIRKICKDEKRFGLLDSGATNNVREVKDDEDMDGVIPIEMQVAFESEVQADLFINKAGTILGPKRTETIVSMNELVKIGFEVTWKEGSVEVQKNGELLQVYLKTTNAIPADYEHNEVLHRWARDPGYIEGIDSIVTKPSPVDGGIVAVVRDSSQIKSADPVTYDEQGNVIPLSQRFKAESNDIRYMPEVTDEQIREVIRSGNWLQGEAQIPITDAVTGENRVLTMDKKEASDMLRRKRSFLEKLLGPFYF
jgi:hypothetical protein